MEQVPDLIISDVMMPKKDGFEVCATLKADQRTSHIPIVLLTAKADIDSKITGLKGGADAYLTKPFNEEELVTRLEKLHDLRLALQAQYSSSAYSVLSKKKSKSRTVDDEFILKLRSVVEANLDNENFGIPELCRAVHMSRTQLHYKIKALTNRPTSHYIRWIRLHKAQELLSEGKFNISQIVMEVGFKSRSYFTVEFKREFGVTPKDFRKTQSGTS